MLLTIILHLFFNWVTLYIQSVNFNNKQARELAYEETSLIIVYLKNFRFRIFFTSNYMYVEKEHK